MIRLDKSQVANTTKSYSKWQENILHHQLVFHTYNIQALSFDSVSLGILECLQTTFIHFCTDFTFSHIYTFKVFAYTQRKP